MSNMHQINTAIHQVISQTGIKTRPNADPGIWLMFLLPFSVILSCIKHIQETSPAFQLCAALSVGLIGTSVIFIIQCARKKPLNIIRTLHLIPATLTATVFRFFLHAGLFISLISGLFSSIFYWKLLIAIFRMFPLSFTLGEVSIAVQGLILFLYSVLVNVVSASLYTPVKVVHISTLIIQLGLCTIGAICLLMYKYKNLRETIPFYMVTVFMLLTFLLFPLHLLLRQNPLFWIIHYLFEDISRMKMVIYWAACGVAAVVAVNRQIKIAKKATPVIRKVFHVLAVAVFLPGLLYECSLLYLASGIVLGIFVMLEVLAILKVPPMGIALHDALVTYRDEKDTGAVAFTPIYLLVGCALPLWIHPAPCDILDSAGFNLLPIMSGVLAIGIGDTVASMVGTTMGKHYWPGTQKTIEGTVGCILSQLATVFSLIHLGFIGTNQNEVIRGIIGIIIGSLIEAKTTQIDNIVLPFVLFIVFN